MKKSFLLSLSLIFWISSFAQWYPVETGTSSRIFSVHFADTEIGWICGTNNLIKQTADGGDTWTETSFHGGTSGSSDFIWYDIFALNETDVYACGSKYNVDRYQFNYARTTNAGSSWTWQTNWGSLAGSWRKVFFIDDQTGWKAGTQGGKGWIGKTSTGMEGFINSAVFDGHSLRSIYFTDQNKGWVVGKDGFAAKSIDAGESWTEIQTGLTQDLEDVFFINASTGWIVGHENDEGIIIKTTDGGTTWSEMNSPATMELYGVYFVNETTGWVCGSKVENQEERGLVLYSDDAGESWTEQYVDSELSEYYTVFFIDEINGWVSGYNGILLKTTNAGGTNFENINENSLNHLQVNSYPNPFTTSTTIEYTLNLTQSVIITFYNQFGKVVDRTEQKQSAGKQQVVWSPDLPGGIYYFCIAAGRLNAGKQIASGKVVLVR